MDLMNDINGWHIGRHGRVAAYACAAMLLVLQPPTALGRVEFTITRVGFPTLRSGDVVRQGEWVPIIVDLALIEQQQEFDGTLRIAQFDSDGDECFDSVDVHLRAETGGTQRLHLYVPANVRRGQLKFTFELLNLEGEAVEVLSEGELTYRPEPAQRPTYIPNDDAILILSLSTGVVGRVSDLVGQDRSATYARPIHVAHISPLDLPEHWIGLEAVDYIVWDDARPEELTQRQLHALLEWTRQGGTLLIAASRSVGALKLTTPLNDVLPVEIGELVAVTDLGDVREALLGAPRTEDGLELETEEWLDVGFDNPVPVARCTLRRGASAIAREGTIDSVVVAQVREDRGHIIYSAVTLRDLFSARGRAGDFFRKLFHLNRVEGDDQAPPQPVSLFNNVVSAISFSTSAGIYLFVAGASAIGYVLLATFGTWGFLRARGGRQHSWSAFALVGLAASAVTMVVVNSLQGFGETLHQVSIIDVDAGSSYARATALFGVKTSSDKELDVWLPSNALGATEPGYADCFLRPLPAGGHRGEAATSFADPQEYRLIPASAVIDNVRVRATLKQFEGRWHGPLDGRVTGQITIRGRRITDDSYVINELGVDLDPCYLIHAALDTAGFEGVRDKAIYVYEIGPVRGDGSTAVLAPRCYEPARNETIRDIINRSTLARWHSEVWGKSFKRLLPDFGLGTGPDTGVALGNERNALMLLSTIGDFDPLSLGGAVSQFAGPKTFSRDRLRQLDLREQLQPGSVILIGFADDPGPIRLFRREGERRYVPLRPEPDRSWTMYRIRIPAVVLRGTADDDVLGMDVLDGP
ncbi:MAG: hypothetical protein ACYTFA_06825 [Planctomycetota bacterium]|jgi:hypothetical protein